VFVPTLFNEFQEVPGRTGHVIFLVRNLMPQLPCFRGYFDLLKIITAVVHFGLGAEGSGINLLKIPALF
jgi:hypothetical protein